MLKSMWIWGDVFLAGIEPGTLRITNFLECRALHHWAMVTDESPKIQSNSSSTGSVCLVKNRFSLSKIRVACWKHRVEPAQPQFFTKIQIEPAQQEWLPKNRVPPAQPNFCRPNQNWTKIPFCGFFTFWVEPAQPAFLTFGFGQANVTMNDCIMSLESRVFIENW